MIGECRHCEYRTEEIDTEAECDKVLTDHIHANHPRQVGPDDYVWIPLEKLTNPVHFKHVEYVSEWWFTVHPRKGAPFYNPRTRRSGNRRRRRYGTPQCNKNGGIVRALLKDKPDGCNAVYVEHAWLPLDVNEYAGDCR